MCPWFSSWQYVNNEWGDGLALNRLQAITLTNDDPVLRHIHASLGPNGLTRELIIIIMKYIRRHKEDWQWGNDKTYIIETAVNNLRELGSYL